jgi:hypothetical protein
MTTRCNTDWACPPLQYEAMYGREVTSITRYGCLVSGASNFSRRHPPFLVLAFTALRSRMKCCNLITQEITCSEMGKTVRHTRNATFHLRSSSLQNVPIELPQLLIEAGFSNRGPQPEQDRSSTQTYKSQWRGCVKSAACSIFVPLTLNLLNPSALWMIYK